jgi:type I restriction enzyme S subunit
VGLKAYPAYRESGVPWLGEVPEHWEVLPAMAAYRPKQVKNVGLVEATVLSLSYGRIIVKPPEKVRGLVPESFETYQIVDPGDIVVRTTDLQNDHTSLRVGYARDRGIITSAYLCLTTTSLVNTEFGYQFLNAYDLLKIIYGFGSGLRQNLDFGEIKRMPVLIPPKAEQAIIVRFLDHLDQQIRCYIRSKQKLIKLLDEQKRLVIDDALASRAAQDAWRKTKLGRVCLSIRDGTHNPPPAVPGVHRLLSVRNIVSGHFVTRPDDRTMSPEAFDELQRSYTVRAGDVVLALVGATTGKSAVVAHLQDVTVQRSIGILRPNPALIDGRYLDLVLRSAVVQTQIRSTMSKYAAQPGIYLNEVSALQVRFPRLAVQQAIVTAVEDQTKRIDRAIDSCTRQITFVREYRTRLIADVATGKLDVREAAARLPEVVEQAGGLDEAEAVDDADAEIDDDPEPEEVGA